MSERSRSVQVVRADGEARQTASDAVAVEDPLEIRIGETPLAVTMRTPCDDEDLVRGFLVTEGIVLDPNEILSFERLDESRISVRFRPGLEIDPSQFQRNMFVSSSCGVCGKASIEQVELLSRPPSPFTIAASLLATLTGRLREQQPTFDTTGGLHAAAVFSVDGALLAAREDVGRHNAVDKAIGAGSRTQWPLPPSVLVVSGRQSFEIVQKAALAGIGGVVGVSAPSSLAVELAQNLGMLLVGFARGESFNVYSSPERVDHDA